MSDDFPFNHFINLDSLNKKPSSNNLDISVQNSNEEPVSNYVFPNIDDKPVNSSTHSQLLSDNNFTAEEMNSINEEIMDGLKHSISPQKYKAFFENSFAISEIYQTKIIFSVTTSFIKKMIESHYLAEIKQIIKNTLGSSYTIEINLINGQASQTKAMISELLSENNGQQTLISDPNEHASAQNNDFSSFFSREFNNDLRQNNESNSNNQHPPKQSRGTSFKLRLDNQTQSKEEINDEIESTVIKQTHDQYKKVKFDTSKTFDNFIVGPSNNMAHAFGIAVSKDPGKVYPQLYIYGNSGLGKTHLLHAICNYATDKKPYLRICFTTANEFMSEMVLAIQSTTGKENKIAEFRRKYTELVDILIIDDIHELKNKTRTQSEFFYIFNQLQSKGKQLIFTSDKPPKEIVGIEDRIRTRLSSALLIDIQQPDLETRIAILKKKSKEKDIYLDDNVINLIASCVKTNVRELEGKLVKLGAYSDLMNVDIDLEIAKEQLNLSEDMDEKILTIETITKTVAAYFKLTLGDIKGKSRKKEVALARHIAMFMSHKILKKTLEEIGEYFDNRDHSTVIHGIKKVQNLSKDDVKLSQQIYEIESRL